MNHLRYRGVLLAFSLLGVMLSFQKIVAQGQYNTTNWRFSNPTPFGFTVIDVDFIDNSNVIAVGGDGGIAKSTDGGTTWTYGAFTYPNAAGQTVKAAFADVHAVNAQVAYAVGSGGLMAKTTDGGTTWSLVKTPLYNKARNINTVWFTSATTGYIGGQHNTPDSLPKLYRTRDGGSTWDSISAPVSGKSRIGYVNNASYAPIITDVTAKDKEIHRIKFINDSVGYIAGSGLSTYISHPAVNSSTGLPNGTSTSSGSHHASLLWKFTSGRLEDFSTSKERLGYSGVTSSPVTNTSRYGSLNNTTQTYKAMHILNDSTVLLMSFNNNIVLRVHTGKNDSIQNMAVPGRFERGRYATLNFPFPPTGTSPIPAIQTLNVSNPYEIKQAANGKLYASGGFGLAATSTDNGVNWRMENILPQGKNFSSLSTWALDISPGGKFLTMGGQGVIADSTAGSTWKSTYTSVPLAGGYEEMEFVDCNTGIATGGSNITVTTDGGKSWTDKRRADFANLFINITGFSFPEASKAYFSTNAGILYRSSDLGTTMDPLYSNTNFQFNDVSTVGKDSIWVVGYNSSAASTLRTSKIFRSVNNGVSFQEMGAFPVGATSPNLTKLAFPSRTVGYAAGTRGGVFRTSDGGMTWTNISPFPSLNATMTYKEVFALNENTVFVTGNGFPRKVVYRSVDGGATWTNITSNIDALGVGNLNGILMHDVNNGYVVSPGGVLLVTNNGGTSWQVDIAPTNNLFETMAFAPRNNPGNLPMNRRRLFVSGFNLPNGGAPMMEYGDTSLLNVSSTEVVTGASCSSPNAGSITITASGGLAPYTYSIDGVNFQTSNVFSGLTRGDKTITVKESGCGRTSSKKVTIPFTDNMTLTATSDTLVCSGATFNLNASTNGTGASFAWTPAAGLGTPGAATTTAVTTTGATYTVTANLNGCVRSKAVVVGLKPAPVVNAGADATVIAGDEVNLMGSSAAIARSIAWTPATGLTNPTEYFTRAYPTQTTTYTLTVVESVSGCTGKDDVVITVIPNCLKVMNAFTPNGDGTNDMWKVTTADACASKVSVSVFNRYGQMVYTNKNYTNNWDGTSNGKPLPDGTYYYLATYTLITGKAVELKGDVTILR